MSERFYGQCFGRKSDGEAEGSDVGGAGVQCPGRESDGEAWMHEMPGTPSANAPGKGADGEVWMQRLPMR